MADGKSRGVDELKTSFMFVRHGDPLPHEWMARHPDWGKFPATRGPRPVPRQVVPGTAWDAAGAGEAAEYGLTSRPVSVGAPAVRRRRVPVHRLPTRAGSMDIRDAIGAYREASGTIDRAASAYLASAPGSCGATEHVPAGHVPAMPDAHTPEIDRPYHDHTHHGDAARPLGHSVSISEAMAHEGFVDAAKASSSPEDTLSVSEQGDKLRGLLGSASLATDPASTIESRDKPAFPNYQHAADDGTPGNNQAQNKQFKDVVRKLKLTYDQKQILHRDISGWDLDYHGIMERAIELFGK